MNELTTALEVILAAVGVTVSLGAPFVVLMTQRCGESAAQGLSLVKAGPLDENDFQPFDRRLVAV